MKVRIEIKQIKRGEDKGWWAYNIPGVPMMGPYNTREEAATDAKGVMETIINADNPKYFKSKNS